MLALPPTVQPAAVPASLLAYCSGAGLVGRAKADAPRARGRTGVLDLVLSGGLISPGVLAARFEGLLGEDRVSGGCCCCGGLIEGGGGGAFFFCGQTLGGEDEVV